MVVRYCLSYPTNQTILTLSFTICCHCSYNLNTITEGTKTIKSARVFSLTANLTHCVKICTKTLTHKVIYTIFRVRVILFKQHSTSAHNCTKQNLQRPLVKYVFCKTKFISVLHVTAQYKFQM